MASAPIAQAKDSEEGLVSVNLRFLLWQSGPTYLALNEESARDYSPTNTLKLHALIPGQESLEIDLRRGRISDAFQYRGPPLMRVTDKPITENTEIGEFSSLALPPDQSELVVIILPPGGRSAKMRLVPISISPSGFPPGSLKVVNFSPTRIAAKVSINDIALEPLGSTVLSVDEELGQRAALKIASWENEEWRLVQTSTISVRENQRSLLMIYPSGRAWKKMVIGNL